MKFTNLRLYHLEREQSIYQQYGRRESFQIVGIPVEVKQEKLEEEVVSILNEAKVQVDVSQIKNSDICAVPRLSDQKTTIVRVVNRKFSYEAIRNGKNLKGTKRYVGNAIYINNSFCCEFQFINFVIRKALRDKLIHKYKIRN